MPFDFQLAATVLKLGMDAFILGCLVLLWWKMKKSGARGIAEIRIHITDDGEGGVRPGSANASEP